MNWYGFSMTMFCIGFVGAGQVGIQLPATHSLYSYSPYDPQFPSGLWWGMVSEEASDEVNLVPATKTSMTPHPILAEDNGHFGFDRQVV